MLTGPVDVTEKLLKKARMKISDIDLFELNEAFAAVVLRYMQAFEIDHSKINVAGGAIAMGHPLGATGAMIFSTVLDELERRDLNTALVTLVHRRRHGHGNHYRARLRIRETDMTYTNFTVETDSDGIALVTWDMPDKSMNVFTEEVMDELDAIVDQVVADDAIKGAVLTSGKKDSFSGGADITMLKRMYRTGGSARRRRTRKRPSRCCLRAPAAWEQLFRKLETCGKPWVSAINGTCMGGAFEVSLACHGRVAADSPARSRSPCPKSRSASSPVPAAPSACRA